jgi:RNA polymerase sigma-70 factor (ECF subfamily)
LSTTVAVTLADSEAFEALARAHRRELQAHCYRMLGSLLDAEDLVQETFLRAWRGRDRFQHQASPRTWLYRIATNTCLSALARRARRVLPEDPGSVSGELAWLEPYPDRLLEQLADDAPGPEARLEQREATELAFVAALQHLPARQRAVLLMRDVLGFSVAEVAYQLASSPASVNSALQRARSTLEQRLPHSGAVPAATLDIRRRRLLERYVASWETGDLDGLMTLLTQDIVLSMPPMPEWFAGHEAVRAFLAWAWGPAGPGPFRLRSTEANGQPAFGLYGRAPEGSGYTPQAIQVLSLDGARIARLHGFVRPELFSAFELPPCLNDAGADVPRMG